jgi:hypothetical protein
MERSVIQIKFLFLFFFIISCGNRVLLKENKLESVSALSTKSFEKSGTLLKNTSTVLKTENKTLQVSRFSSKSALDFIQLQKPGLEVPVIYTGGISSNEVVIETIRNR